MIRAIILAGGSGKRMWPLSREKRPKQLLNLFLEKSFLAETISRFEPIVDSVLISTGKNLEKEIHAVLPKEKLIVEPERRDTAAAIGLCAVQFDEKDTLVFAPSDHFIEPVEKFRETIKKAAALAEKEKAIVVIGVKPTGPATIYGYIEPDKKNKNKVLSFREKPTKEIAEQYVTDGYLWNAGIFVCNAGVMLDLFKMHAPDIYEELLKIKNGGSVESVYPNIRKISFDFAVMEKNRSVFYLPADFYWNDIGGFPAITEVVKDENVVMNGKFIELESRGNIVNAEDKNKTIALIGCNDLVVIDTKDALLVCPKSSAEKIKKLVEEKVPQELQ
jgi:mannose-1-phosphate guanylyltransferase